MSGVSLKKEGDKRWNQYSPEEATQFYKSGHYSLSKKATVSIRMPDGSILKGSGSGVNDLMEQGGVFANVEDLKLAKERELEAKYGNRPLSTALITAPEGILPIGGAEVSQAIAEILGNPEAPRELKRRNEAAAITSEVASSLLIGSGTIKLGKYLGKTLAKKGIKAALAKATGMGVAAGLEGTAYGAGDVTAETSLGNQDLTAEQALTHIGLIGGLSAGLGGALELVGPGVRKLGALRRAKQAARSTRVPVPSKEAIQRNILKAEGLDISDEMAKGIQKVISTPAPKNVKDPKVFDMLFDRDLRKSVQRGEQLVKKAETAIPEKINTALRSGDATEIYRKFSIKADELAHRMPKESFDEAFTSARAMAESMESMAKEESRYTYRRLAQRLKKDLDNIAAKKNIKDVFETVDRAKFDMDVATQGYWRSKKFGAPVDTHEESFIRMHRKNMQDHLEDQAFYKGAAVAQSEINAAKKSYLSSHSEFNRYFTYLDPNGARVAEPTKVSGVIKKLGTRDKEKYEQFLFAELDRRKELNRVMQKWYRFDDVTKKAVAEAEDAMESIAKDFTDMTKDAKNFNIWRELNSKYGNISNLAASTGAGLLGGAAFGPVGAVAGTLARGSAFRGTAMDNAMRALSWLDDLSVKRTSKAATPLREWLISPKAVSKVSKKKGVVKGGDILKLAFRRIPIAMYSDVLEGVMSESTDISDLPDRVSEELPALWHAPQTAAKTAEVRARAVEYLKSSIPKETIRQYMEPSVLGFTHKKHKPPDFVQRKFLRIAEVLDDPSSVVPKLIEGSLTKDEVTAVQAVYPQIYQILVDTVTEAMFDLAQKGETVPYQKRISLSILLGTPLDSTADPIFIQKLLMASAKAGPNEEAGAPKGASMGKSSKVPGMYRPGSFSGLDQYERR